MRLVQIHHNAGRMLINRKDHLFHCDITAIRTHRRRGRLLSQHALTASNMAEAARAWDLGTLLAPIARRAPQTPYAVVMLNTPIPLGQKEAFLQLWKGAALRICADGASNRLLDTFGSTGTLDIPMPNLICGDLDSMRDDTRTFFEKQYATDLQKSVQAVEDAEAPDHAATYQLVILGGMSGRLDQTIHTLHVLWQLAPGLPVDGMIHEPHVPGTEPPRGSVLRKRPHTLIVSDECATCLLPAGEHVLRHDPAILGISCGILPLGVGPQGAHVHTKGLEWNLRTSQTHAEGEASCIGGFLSTSNHLAPDNPDGTVWIKTDAPIYWTVQLRAGA